MPTEAREGSPLATVTDSVATIMLNRPSKHNRMEPDDVEAMSGLIEDIANRRDIRAVIFRARGRSFCSGFDLRVLVADDPSRPVAAFLGLCDSIADIPQPTICALQGGVFGGGVDLALACDIRIGVSSTLMAMPPGRLGIQYGFSGIQRLVQRLGSPVAKQILLTSEVLSSDVMLRIGFLNEITEDAVFDRRVKEVSAACVAQAPGATRGLKQSINMIERHVADPDLINQAFYQSLASASAQTGVNARLRAEIPIFEDESC